MRLWSGQDSLIAMLLSKPSLNRVAANSLPLLVVLDVDGDIRLIISTLESDMGDPSTYMLRFAGNSYVRGKDVWSLVDVDLVDCGVSCKTLKSILQLCTSSEEQKVRTSPLRCMGVCVCVGPLSLEERACNFYVLCLTLRVVDALLLPSVLLEITVKEAGDSVLCDLSGHGKPELMTGDLREGVCAGTGYFSVFCLITDPAQCMCKGS